MLRTDIDPGVHLLAVQYSPEVGVSRAFPEMARKLLNMAFALESPLVVPGVKGRKRELSVGSSI
jgi:hypothetical protein